MNNLPLKESHELHKACCLYNLLHCNVVLFGGRKTANRSWHLWEVFEVQKHECYIDFSMIIRSQVGEEGTLFGEGSRQGVVFSLCRDSLSLITLAHALMTVAIETSRCTQLKFVPQSFQPCQWSMALEVRELLFIPEGRSWHRAKSCVSSICGSPGALFQRREGAKKGLTQN